MRKQRSKDQILCATNLGVLIIYACSRAKVYHEINNVKR